MDHLRYAGASSKAQRAAFLDIVWRDPLVREALQRARNLDLPHWWIVSGTLYNTIWNNLTRRPSGYGIKDIDFFYFDDSDLSWGAEDVIIRRGEEVFAGLPKPVEIRNQARVHLWYEQRFGRKCPPLSSCRDSIARFATRTHAVGVRLEHGGGLELCAPYGLEDIFAFRVVPNRIVDNRAIHETKAARAKATWPELTVIPW
ncbi:nucleotidyltransferase family protein [Chelativorans salis]|uniref:Nucleotidyltransferase family protein n=1 Tax=Chelativorans salis TaxID=2978478 RepID=A0ABT2LVG2_9HYPH|nr:nucleotidyltransferase family protein [Chelativorans sp. EGI FJ00035]MCT7378527.1 nucleotidyltransferase family protein [Chelativorans sp. EGI FJ00035]